MSNLTNKEFFNIQDFLDDRFIITCVISDRGLGKTHSTTNFVVNECRRTDTKFVITRLTYEVFKQYRDDIKNMCGLDCNFEGKRLLDDKKHIGYLTSLNTYANAKGGTYNDVRYMVFDEFNEDVVLENAYAKFIMLVDSFKRHRKNFKAILLGNMINKNNWFLNALGLRIDWKAEQDQIIDYEKERIRVVVIGTKSYSKLKQERQDINDLAALDPSAHAFYNEREFLNDESDKITNFKVWVEKTFVPLYTYRYGEFRYIFGKYKETDGKTYFFTDRSVGFYNKYIDKVPDISFDILGNFGSKKTQVLDENDIKMFQEQFFLICKQERLKFGSFDAWDDLQRFIGLGTMF